MSLFPSQIKLHRNFSTLFPIPTDVQSAHPLTGGLKNDTSHSYTKGLVGMLDMPHFPNVFVLIFMIYL